MLICDSRIIYFLPEAGTRNSDPSLDDMTSYPFSDHSHNDIERVGKIIAAENLLFKGAIPADIRDAFLIANDWRDAHAFPMRSIHFSIRYHMRANNLEGVTAARLKRMQAIRRKLRRIGLGFDQIQDLGGCRVILSNIADARTLIAILREKIPSDIFKEADYISKPKKDGYRSHHLILSFRRPKKTPYDGKRIELQVRTQIQHSWATAVEAVGLYRGEQLKNNHGDANWLRLFTLMSAEFAEIEGCPLPPGTPERELRRSEIKQLASSLDAVTVLEAVIHGFRGPDTPLDRGYKPTHYLIRWDHATKTVQVEPYNKAINATKSYDKAEAELRTGEEKDQVVLVEVDKIDNLKAAYPNYFGDVEYFKHHLKAIAQGAAAVDYMISPKQPPARQLPEDALDPAWLKGTRFPKPNLGGKKKKTG